MKIVNIHVAKAYLSRLIEEAAAGELFFIAKAGKTMVKVEPITQKPPQRIGFMEGEFEVPDDFDTMFAKEVEEMFYGGPLEPPMDKQERF